jgi:hypothetical protein
MLHLARTAFATLSLFCCAAAEEPSPKPEPAKPAAHEQRDIEGWTVRVDTRLLAPPHKELGTRAVALLTAKLADIKLVMADDRLVALQRASIVLDLTHGSLTSMQYHPSADWLAEHGFSRDLERCVHIPVAERFTHAMHNHVQPWCVLHELAHAYHDQVLGFEEPRVKQVWQRYVNSGHGVRALHLDGRTIRHYALTNQKEFFAEMTECYFGTNDFFPFVHGELKQAEPEVFSLLREIWGEVAAT